MKKQLLVILSISFFVMGFLTIACQSKQTSTCCDKPSKDCPHKNHATNCTHSKAQSNCTHAKVSKDCPHKKMANTASQAGNMQQTDPTDNQNALIDADTTVQNQIELETDENGIQLIKYKGNYVSCPIMGHHGHADLYRDYQGKRYYFCCKGCPDEFMAEPETYLQKGAMGIPLSDLEQSELEQ